MINNALEDDEFGFIDPSIFCLKENETNVLEDDDEFGTISLDVFCYQEFSITTETDVGIKLFAHPPKNGEWYIDRKKMMSFEEIEENKNIAFPLNIDTEFTDKDHTRKFKQKGRKHVTTQMRGIRQDAQALMFLADNDEIEIKINAARKRRNLKPLPRLKSSFNPIDYLNYCGLEVSIKKSNSEYVKSLPKCIFILYGHFLLAEINLICDGSVKYKIKELQRETGHAPRLDMARRLRCSQYVDGSQLDYVDLNHIVSINGFDYAACLKIVDTGAIHGVQSYANFCKAVGWKLEHKEVFTSKDKENILNMAIERPEDYENYGLGDLDVYDALEMYKDYLQVVYEKMDLAEYYSPPDLTIGGTVKKLFEASLAKYLNIKNQDKLTWRDKLTEIVDKFIKPVSADELRHYTKLTRALLSKVEGGRCRNNRPTDVQVLRKIKNGYDVNLICDIDISGCYGEGQRNQDYFIGLPEIWDYKVTSKNDYVTLRNWLKAYDVPIEELIKKNFSDCGELIPGAWIARIATSETLKYGQDFFASWFTTSGNSPNLMTKFIKRMSADTDLTNTDWVDFDEAYGQLKIFNNEIHNALLQHDGLEWIFSVCSPRQRNELLDKLIVLTSSVYPKNQQIEPDIDKLIDYYDKWTGRNTTERIKNEKGQNIIRMNFNECHAWFPINMGELIVNTLLIERKKAQILEGKKTPLDTLFKLCVNTLYGDMCSKFFVTSNPVVGNNITARARALAWYMEKGLHGWQSITDGCAFELNGTITHGRDKVNGESINLHRDDSPLKRRKIKKTTLNNNNSIICKWVEYNYFDKDKKEIKTGYTPQLNVDGIEYEPILIDDIQNKGCQILKDNPALDWIADNSMKHLQNLFENVSVLHSASTVIKITKSKDIQVDFVERKGQFSFEVKDLYHSASFHGSANYLLENPNSRIIKARGYENKKEHLGFVSDEEQTIIMVENRYGANNPAKDMLNGILSNPENVKRQIPALKKGILKLNDYRNLAGKYDALKLEPGDSIKRSFLLQEFSLSQFTFQTYEQFVNWSKVVDRMKHTDKQSLEAFFLNSEGNLNFKELCITVDRMIAQGVFNPYESLDPDRHRKRASKLNKKGVKGVGKKATNIITHHPHLDAYNTLRDELAGIEE